MTQEAFKIENLSDTCVSIGSTQYNLSVTAMSTHGWILVPDTQNIQQLCNFNSPATNVIGVFKRTNLTTYTLTSAEFFGQRPPRG